jgi:hypothetical protein
LTPPVAASPAGDSTAGIAGHGWVNTRPAGNGFVGALMREADTHRRRLRIPALSLAAALLFWLGRQHSPRRVRRLARAAGLT